MPKKRIPMLEDAHEWISFEDPHEQRRWVFDVTFLLSSWECIFGRGCKGVLTEDAPELVLGCCSYGAHFTDEDDAARVEATAATMGPDVWQFAKQGRAKGVVRRKKDGEITTRIVQDACIFLNRPGFANGPGCALHQVAVARGERPLDLKPAVCWQLPLRREDADGDDGWVTSTVREWQRRHWGDGGFEFSWWCTDAPDAFVGRVPVYVSLRDELVELCGQEVYDMVVTYLDRRVQAPTAPLPHPGLAKH